MDTGFKPQILISSQDKRRRWAPIVSAAQPICQVCNTQFSQYTCPHCNLHYCSLPCFRAPLHAGCSESFDRKELVDDIQTNKARSEEEKGKMMELLKRFEEQQGELEEGGSEDGSGEVVDDETRALREKLDGVDLDALSPDDLLAFLSPAQLASFESTLADPSKVNALVEAEFEPDAPWWEVPEPEAPHLDENVDLSEEDDGSEGESWSARPALVVEEDLPPLRKVDGNVAVNPKLVYNVVAVLFAYAYTLRTFSLESFSALPPTSTERNTAIELLAHLLPFLVERSTDVFPDVGSAVDSVLAREQHASTNSGLISILMADVSLLLQPVPIAPLSPTANPLLAHPLAHTLHALSDIVNLFTPPTAKPSKPSLIQRPNSTQCALSTRQLTAAAQKLKFYASFTVSGAEVRQVGEMAESMRAEAIRRLEEERERQEEVGERKDERERRKGETGGEAERVAEGPKIVEL